MLIAILIYLILTLYAAILFKTAFELRNPGYSNKLAMIAMLGGSLIFGVAEAISTYPFASYAVKQKEILFYSPVFAITIVNIMVTIWAMKLTKKKFEKAIILLISALAIVIGFICGF